MFLHGAHIHARNLQDLISFFVDKREVNVEVLVSDIQHFISIPIVQILQDVEDKPTRVEEVSIHFIYAFNIFLVKSN